MSELKAERAALPLDLVAAHEIVSKECGDSYPQYFLKLAAAGIDLKDAAVLHNIGCLLEIPAENRPERITGWRERGLVPVVSNGNGAGNGHDHHDVDPRSLASEDLKNFAVEDTAANGDVTVPAGEPQYRKNSMVENETPGATPGALKALKARRNKRIIARLA
jgi:hypothetical protein